MIFEGDWFSNRLNIANLSEMFETGSISISHIFIFKDKSSTSGLGRALFSLYLTTLINCLAGLSLAFRFSPHIELLRGSSESFTNLTFHIQPELVNYIINCVYFFQTERQPLHFLIFIFCFF